MHCNFHKSNKLINIYIIFICQVIIKRVNAQYSNYHSFNQHFQYQQHYYRAYNEQRNQKELEQLKEKYCELPDFYKLFDVSKNFDNKELKKQWKKLSRETHPDKNLDKENSEKQFQLVQEAYDVLKDEEARQKYDRVKEIYCVHYKPKRQPGTSDFSGFSWYNLFLEDTDKTISDIFKEEDIEMQFAGMFPGIRKHEKLYLAVMIRIMINFTKYFLLIKTLYTFVARNMIYK